MDRGHFCVELLENLWNTSQEISLFLWSLLEAGKKAKDEMDGNGKCNFIDSLIAKKVRCTS